jgi:hypothetical protein
MGRHRTAVFLVLVALSAAGFASTASGRESGPVPRLIFPLVAKTVLWDNYGDPRPNGHHAGIDMENPWRAPVVAVEDGMVKYWESGLGGCMLYLPKRNDVHVHPAEQRCHGEERQQRRVRQGRFVHRPQRREGLTAYTMKANATQAAIVGAPGELLLARVAPSP